MHTGVSSSGVGWQVCLERYTRVLMKASLEFPNHFLKIYSKEIHANHLEAFHTSLRRRCAAYRRRTNMYAKHTGQLQERLDVYWIVHNFVRVHFTTRQVPAVALGVLEDGLSLNEIFLIQTMA